MATTWEKLLHITGGKLELSKCFWIPIIWGWKKGQLVMRKNSRQKIEIWGNGMGFTIKYNTI